jgi:hypothetical protein
LSVLRAIKQTKINRHILETFFCIAFFEQSKRRTSAEQNGFLLRAANIKTKRMQYHASSAPSSAASNLLLSSARRLGLIAQSSSTKLRINKPIHAANQQH